ncbi:hypothetical protein IQ268_03745 [Oculatella sp. LEGE 06141]|uniref:hypothetical protein n=1 Tax=Oculatella sp. LEGE 06141 TaxID=1828648 RepID=UPI001880FBD4|nr:hypothetical protein [Oculatella sp. LEGE 06141]MBE9177692.1 hypothetical protein [Oculatella sp. LEGE 06141]
MYISSFELLVKPIAPKPFPSNVSRRVVQAYFLSISNLDSAEDVVLSLQFTGTPTVTTDNTFTIFDSGSSNMFGELAPDSVTGKPSQILTLAKGQTGLFVLQPDLSKPGILDEANLEVRGYVELFISPLSPSDSAELLISPQIRGTFLPSDLTDPNPDFDQQAYSLPTANGTALIKLER